MLTALTVFLWEKINQIEPVAGIGIVIAIFSTGMAIAMDIKLLLWRF